MDYNLRPEQVLNMLGYTEPVGEEFINGFESQYNVKLPLCLRNFYKFAYKCPLLSTADIWTDRMGFLYEVFEEQIEEFEEEYGDNPEEGADDEYYSFSQFLSKIPREQWQEHVTDYLEIGSDYGAGVVNYGICVNDLGKDDPPVYFLNEDNEYTEWEPLCDTLSEYFMLVICDALSCLQYDTARRVLKKAGRDFKLYESNETEETAKEMGIDLSVLKKQVLSWGEVACGYDKEKKLLVTAGINDNYKYDNYEYPFWVCTVNV